MNEAGGPYFTKVSKGTATEPRGRVVFFYRRKQRERRADAPDDFLTAERQDSFFNHVYERSERPDNTLKTRKASSRRAGLRTGVVFMLRGRDCWNEGIGDCYLMER